MKSKFDSYIESVIVVSESITFSVADAENPPLDVLDTIHVLNRYLYKFLQKNLTPEQMEEYQNKRVIDILSPDGFDAFEKEGIINFYTQGIPDEFKDKIITMLKYYIGESNAEVSGEVKKDVSRLYNSEVYRIPIKVHDFPEEKVAPELNLSNGNARVLICDILNYPSDMMDGGSVSIAELMMKVGMIKDNDYIINKNVRPEKVSGGNGSATFIDSGLSKEQIKRYLDHLEKLTEWGQKNHYSTISWG